MSALLPREGGSNQIILRPDVLQELRVYQASTGASDYSSAITQLLRDSRQALPSEPCRHTRCAHRRERDCTSECRRPGRPRSSA